jgi:hypothetical protein
MMQSQQRLLERTICFTQSTVFCICCATESGRNVEQPDEFILQRASPNARMSVREWHTSFFEPYLQAWSAAAEAEAEGAHTAAAASSCLDELVCLTDIVLPYLTQRKLHRSIQLLSDCCDDEHDGRMALHSYIRTVHGPQFDLPDMAPRFSLTPPTDGCTFTSLRSSTRTACLSSVRVALFGGANQQKLVSTWCSSTSGKDSSQSLREGQLMLLPMGRGQQAHSEQSGMKKACSP